MTRRSWLLSLAAVTAYAQSAAPLAFEVASIKAWDHPRDKLFTFSSSGPRATLEGYLATHLVMDAYHLKNYQVAYASAISPDDRTYYDIVAKAPGDAPPTRNEFRRMLQTLLAERFHFQFHREMREMPVYALVVGKQGPKFKESPADAKSSGHFGVNGRNQTMKITKGTMSEVAEDLVSSFSVDRPVVDQTGLTGAYDIQFEATPEGQIRRNPEFGDISVFTAVQEQLGLKLEARKLPVEVLVIDRIDKPTAN